jgi:hypothetical protein
LIIIHIVTNTYNLLRALLAFAYNLVFFAADPKPLLSIIHLKQYCQQ